MVKRLNYFDGQFLRPKDFIDEQSYHIGMRQMHNSLLHTWGVANGLTPSANTGATQIKVSPGFAIDRYGREIQLDSDGLSDDLTAFAGKSPYVTIAWNEVPTDKSTEAGATGDTRIELQPLIKVVETPKSGEQLVLGKVALDAQGRFQSVDTSSGVRTMAGARGGDLSVISLTLTGLNIDAGQQPRLSVSTPGQVDVGGSLQVKADLGIAGRVGIGTTTPLTSLQISPKITDDARRSLDAGALMVIHQTPTSAAALNDPKDVLYLGRQGTSGQAYGAMATFKLSRYENAGGSNVGSRTRLDLALTHDNFNDVAVMSWLSSGNVGIGSANPTASLHLKDASSNRFTLRVQSAAANTANAWGGIGFSGEDANTKGAIIFQSLGADYSRGNLIFALNNAEDQTNASPADAVMTLASSGGVGIKGIVTAPAFVATNPMTNRMYPNDALIYQDIFAARDAGAIKKFGNPVYDDTTWTRSNPWNLRPIIKFGANGNTADGNGALVTVPAGYNTAWVRVLGERWNTIQAVFQDGAKENLGRWVGGFRSLNNFAPDGATADGAWVGRDHKDFPGVMAHEWLPIAAGRSGQLLLTAKDQTNAEFWISGLAFSRNPWSHAAQSAVAYYWASNGGTAVGWNSECWQHDVLAMINAGTKPIMKVPVLPSGRDKLLYIIEHNNNWVGAMHEGITVNGMAIERFTTTYDNPFARHWNSKCYERYLAARIPKELIQNRYLDVQIDLSLQPNNLNFREMGTHDFQVPAAP
jgi:hypothetical protein